ncbi:MAG: HAD hydrolase family protein [Pirellulaceae bacterium]|jgi:YrbI family 3-deoxy-D-manno-octulosonate 8-phosphate phosphatase|nr:HAD hydrolase family protein [Pirellulaceae bacterium]MDP7015305.1 HAD hydrolase family protein [Pirellulaceae bacterium]
MKLDSVFRQIELILSDVDGVLTNGGIIYDNQGIEAKQFNIRDGLGIRLWKRAGYAIGILTARNSHIVKVRAAELDVEMVRQGFENKLPTALEMIESQGLAPEQVCYIGDDLPDLPVIRAVGLGVAVADAVDEVAAAAKYVTKKRGGEGAVRETIEKILQAKGQWEDLLRSYD